MLLSAPSPEAGKPAALRRNVRRRSQKGGQLMPASGTRCPPGPSKVDPSGCRVMRGIPRMGDITRQRACLGCKRSRVQIPAARPNNSKTYKPPFLQHPSLESIWSPNGVQSLWAALGSMATTTVPTVRHFYSTAYPSGQHGQDFPRFCPSNFAWRENSFPYTERVLPILPTRTASSARSVFC